ncbi:MAG: hypothetical protein MZV64_10945 [Ignavibacteriales bacterium]|nr:hypothetical protein [Ignavibacteriales bacterium]
MKRTERHHLQEDGMVHGMSRAVDFIRKYRREITIVAGALVFAAVVFGALALLRSHNRSVLSRAVGQVTELSAEVAQKPEKLAGAREARRARAHGPPGQPGAGQVLGGKERLGQGGVPPGRDRRRPQGPCPLPGRGPQGPGRARPEGLRQGHRHLPEDSRREARRLPARRRPVPPGRELRAQGGHRHGPRPLQEAPGRVRPVLLRLRGLPQGRQARAQEVGRICQFVPKGYNIP